VRGTRADRTLTEITVALPPCIATRTRHTAEPGLAGLLTRAADRLRALDEEHGARLGAVGRLLVRTESVASSRIEHVDASADDYGRALVGSRANPAATSMVAATDALDRLVHAPVLGERALLDAHGRLMRDDPIDGRYAGRYRDVQNWIGGGRSPRDAVHVPPPPELVPDLMADLFAFLGRDDVDPIAQAAIGHAHFESIHPFTDGNGRIGRALVGALLRRRGLSRTLVVPIATALAADREQYFARLAAYRDGHVDDLVATFATAIGIVCDESAVAAIELEQLPGLWWARVRIPPVPRELLDALVEHAVLDEDMASSLVARSGAGLDAALAPLIDAGVLRQITERERNRAWTVVDLVAELECLSDRITAAVVERRHRNPRATRAAAA
jgi:Fic family protein